MARKKTQQTPPIDPVESARAADLQYVTDEEPGISRQRKGKGFTYIDPEGETITGEERERIEGLAIPPAWTEVWICPDPDGHIQATGRDEKGRKQYIYHPRWREVRDQVKYHHMLAFSQALPTIRERVQKDLSKRGLPRERVLAAVVRLLEMTMIRIGNPEYARQNQSYGLTTLRDKHVAVDGSHIEFEFRGKSGIEHALDIEDRRLAKIIKASQELPGQKLFQYLDEEGNRQAISSEDVNAYLREITGEDFTAKDFRTWGGTLLAACALLEIGECETEPEAKKNITQAVKAVARQLGNTAAICRKYYIHPRILEAYQQKSLIRALKKHMKQAQKEGSSSLDPTEVAVAAIIAET